jgi:hypothetical protein
VAQEAYERIVKTARLADSRWVFSAQIGLGDFLQQRGNLSGALKIYSDNLSFADRLAKSDAGNAGWQRDLVVSFEWIGDVQKAQGDLSGALKSYSDGLAIRGKLAKSDPDNAGWQRDLAVLSAKRAPLEKQND